MFCEGNTIIGVPAMNVRYRALDLLKLGPSLETPCAVRVHA